MSGCVRLLSDIADKTFRYFLEKYFRFFLTYLLCDDGIVFSIIAEICFFSVKTITHDEIVRERVHWQLQELY